MSLDLVVSQSILRIRALERALHDEGPWFIVLNGFTGDIEVPATRYVTDSDIRFAASMGSYMLHADTASFIRLRCRQDDVLTRRVEIPETGAAVDLGWVIGLDSVAA